MEGNSTLEEFGKNLGCFRFVVLEHELPPESGRTNHWDLLLEQPPVWGGMLLSFEVSNPLAEWGPPTAVLKLPDHRPLYLSYEGPISGNRGSVRRVLEGQIRWLEKTSDLLRFCFQPRKPSNGNLYLEEQAVLTISKSDREGNDSEWEMELQPSFKHRECEAPAELGTALVRQEPHPPHPPEQ